MELTVVTEPLAEAAALFMRMSPGRLATASVLLRASGNGMELTGGDGETSARVWIAAAVHQPGEVAVSVQLGEGVLVIRGSDEQAGESEETIKADVRGALLTHAYQSRYLLDALRGFAGQTVTMQIQSGIRPTVFARPTNTDPINLRYLIVPLRQS